MGTFIDLRIPNVTANIGFVLFFSRNSPAAGCIGITMFDNPGNEENSWPN